MEDKTKKQAVTLLPSKVKKELAYKLSQRVGILLQELSADEVLQTVTKIYDKPPTHYIDVKFGKSNETTAEVTLELYIKFHRQPKPKVENVAETTDEKEVF